MSYLVKDYMTKEVLTIDENQSAADAATTMATDQMAQGYVIVLSKGSPIGIVTQRDLVNKILATGTTRRVLVTEIMSAPIISIDPDEDLLKASEIMREHNVRKVPVIRDGIVYGVVTARDIAHKCGIYVDKSIRDIVRWTAPLGI